jgi:serpin B
MKKSITIIVLALITSLTICSTLNGFAQQRSEDLKSIPGTWWFMAKLDNPVDTLLIIRSDLQPPMKVKTLAKDEHGMFLFYTPLTEPCNYIIFTPPSVDFDDFFSFNVHAEPGEVLSVQGCYDVNKPAHGLTFGGSRYYVDYADAFMRLNSPPQEEADEDCDSVLLIIDGKMLPRSMNPQLLNHIPRRHGEGEHKGVLQQSIAEGYLKKDLQPYFFKRKQYIDNIRVLIDATATAIYGSLGRYGAIEITTRPFLSVAPMSPNVSKARRLTFLLDTYPKTYGYGSYSLFGNDGFIFNGESHALDPDLFDTPVKEQFFGQMTWQHGHMTNEHYGPVGSDAHGIYVPLIREVEVELPSKVNEAHFDSIVNAIRQAARQADKAIERTDSLVRLAFIFGGKVQEGKPHPFITHPLKKDGPIAKESSYYFTPDAKAESYWWAEACYRSTSPRRLVMNLFSVDKLYASDCPAILENRRHIEGTVLDDDNGTPVADALVFIESAMGTYDAGGVRTDDKGHFALWLPYRNQQVRVRKSGYKDAIWIQPADTALTIRLISESSPKSQPSPFKAANTTEEGAVKGDPVIANGNNPRIRVSLTDEEQALVTSVNNLGFNMFRKAGANESILLSPLGMTYALGLVSNGAGGKTRTQINQVLGCDDKKAAIINQFCRKMLTEAPRIDKLTTLEISNEFTSHKSAKPKPAFTQVATDSYDTQFKESASDPSRFSLVNTIYFKGIWTDKFQKANTRDEVFRGEDGKKTTVPMMNQMRQFFYTDNALCQALCLPYSNGAYQMIVLLPKAGKTVQEVAQSLTADSWQKMYDQMRRIDVDVKLPRFESSSEVNLTGVMSALMPHAFDIKKANFSNLFEIESCIDKIKQKGRIKVDETGAEAFAITSLQGDLGSLHTVKPETVCFHATHPFLYFIREWSTGTIFFIGQYM